MKITNDHHRKIFISLFFICLAATLPSDLYVAGLPTISRVMKSSIYCSQLTVTIFLLGFALAQFVYGPLSDHYGRKKIILVALVIAVLGSIICCFSNTIPILLLGRFFQGLGASACLSIPRAILRDIFHGNRMSKNISYLSACVETITAVSPFVGGYVVQHFSWQYNFYILLFINIVTMAVVLVFLPETNLNTTNKILRFFEILNCYRKYILNPGTLFYALCGCIGYTNLMIYFTVSPFLLQNDLKISPQDYGFFTLFVSFSLVIGAVLNSKLVEHCGINKMILLSSALIIFSGLLLFVGVFFSYLNMVLIIFSCIVAVIGSALLFANAISGALTHIQKDIGIVSALYGGLQIGGSFFIIGFVIQLTSLSDMEKLAYTFSILGIILFIATFVTMKFENAVHKRL